MHAHPTPGTPCWPMLCCGQTWPPCSAAGLQMLGLQSRGLTSHHSREMLSEGHIPHSPGRAGTNESAKAWAHQSSCTYPTRASATPQRNRKSAPHSRRMCRARIHQGHRRLAAKPCFCPVSSQLQAPFSLDDGDFLSSQKLHFPPCSLSGLPRSPWP